VKLDKEYGVRFEKQNLPEGNRHDWQCDARLARKLVHSKRSTDTS